MKLHLVGIELKNGDVIYSLHRSRQAAEDKVTDFARHWWDDLFVGVPGAQMPADDAEVVRQYFERAGELEQESYIITEVTVED